MIIITVNKQTFMKTWWETYMCARPNTLLLPHSQHRPLCFWESPTCTTTLKTHYKHWTTETVQKSQLLQQQKIDTTIRTFKGRLFKDPNDDILDETLTTMESTWTNTDTYGTVFEILKSWDPSTKLDSSKDQWKYNDTRCTYDEHVKRRLRASLHKQLKSVWRSKKKKKMGNKACVCVWGNNGEMHRDLMYWHGCKSIGLYTGFQGSRTTEKLAVLVPAMHCCPNGKLCFIPSLRILRRPCRSFGARTRGSIGAFYGGPLAVHLSITRTRGSIGCIAWKHGLAIGQMHSGFATKNSSQCIWTTVIEADSVAFSNGFRTRGSFEPDYGGPSDVHAQTLALAPESGAPLQPVLGGTAWQFEGCPMDLELTLRSMHFREVSTTSLCHTGTSQNTQ